MIDLNQYLAANGYATLEDWGRDSDYFQTTDGLWVDEDGHAVDLYAQWVAAMESLESGPRLLTRQDEGQGAVMNTINDILRHIESGELSEYDSFRISEALRDKYGWAGTFYSRGLVEEIADLPLTDEEWDAVQRTWEWRKGIQHVFVEYGWKLIRDAVQEGVETVEKVYAALERNHSQRALNVSDGE